MTAHNIGFDLQFFIFFYSKIMSQALLLCSFHKLENISVHVILGAIWIIE